MNDTILVIKRNRIFFILITSVLVLGALALVFAAQWSGAGINRGQNVKLDSKAAWVKLQHSAQSRLQSASDQAATARLIMSELTNFAETYAGTREAVNARFNHGVLAAALRDYEAAEKSLTEALKQADDPQMVMAIRAQLGKLSIQPGSTPPDFRAYALDGREISPSDYTGMVLLLDFWATWCGPCIVELPNVKRIYEKYNDGGFEIVSISIDRDEELLREFIKQENLDWTHIYNRSLPLGQDIATQYGVDAIPLMILVGSDGKIVDIDLRGPDLEEAVKRAVNTD